MSSDPIMTPDPIADRLRAAGSVFAEEEAAVLRRVAHDAQDLEARVRRRADGEMLEHVLEEVEFAGLRLHIGPGCFVPRRRTRLLARLAATAACAAGTRTGRPPTFLEACAGIAPLSAFVHAAVPGAVIHAADADPVPLAQAERNLPAGAGVHEGDLLEALPDGLCGTIDVIAAVAPYVPRGAFALLPREVREHEPGSALLGGDDGLDVVRRLLQQAPVRLAPGGRILLEMHQDQATALAAEGVEPLIGLRMHRGIEGSTGVLEASAGAGAAGNGQGGSRGTRTPDIHGVNVAL